MKRITVYFVFVLLLSFFVAGCSSMPGQPSSEAAPDHAPANESVYIPTLEELIEINDLENVFQDHVNMYITVESKSSTADLNYTEEVIYIKDDAGLNYHKRSKKASATDYSYTSLVGNALYFTDATQTVSMLMEGEDSFFDYTLLFASTPIGKGYLENDQIVYHSYEIFEADEFFDASRDDYTLYFNKDTKLIERIDRITYEADHQIQSESSTTVLYDEADVETRFDKTCYDIIMSSENLINLEILVDEETSEQTSYRLVTTTDSQVYAAFNNLTYLFYSDSAYQNPVMTLEEYQGNESLTLYAKKME